MPERGATARGRGTPWRHRSPCPGTSRSCPSPCSPRASGRGGRVPPSPPGRAGAGTPAAPPGCRYAGAGRRGAAGPGRGAAGEERARGGAARGPTQPGAAWPGRAGPGRAAGARTAGPRQGAARPPLSEARAGAGGGAAPGRARLSAPGRCGTVRSGLGRGPRGVRRPPGLRAPVPRAGTGDKLAAAAPCRAARCPAWRGGGASTPAPQRCAPRGVSSRRGQRAQGSHPAAASPGWGATRPSGLDRRVRVLSTGRPHCARGHPPSHGRARRWAPGGGYRAEGNGAGGSGASGTETEDSRAGDIGTAGNGAACAALAVRCPSGSARCRAPGAARAWSERPPPLPPPPPSFSSPRCGASVAPRCGSRCPGAGSGGRVCARGVCALGSPRAEPLRSVPCRTPGAAASRPPPLPGPRRARSPLPPSPRSLPRSLPAPARSLSGPAPPRGPGRAARRDPQSAGRLGGSRPRRTDYGSRQPARPRLALALTLRLPLPVSPPP